MSAQRSTITFTGRVQGVGFRATTQSIARQFDVTGWVRNEPDGSVTCVVEGESAEVDRFVNQVKTTMDRHILDVRIEQTNATGEFGRFRITH